MKTDNNTKKNIVLAAVSLTVVAALVLAMVLPFVLNRTDDIGYSYEEDNQPIEYPLVERIIFNQKISNMLRDYFSIIDNNNHIGRFLLSIMSRARIPTEKLKPFANYMDEFANIIITSGFSAPQTEEGLYEYEVISGLRYHLNMFVEKTSFTEIELARFVYEFVIVLTEDTEVRSIIISIGQDDFVTLFTNTIFAANTLTDSINGEMNQAEARAFQGIIYSLGVEYSTLLDKLGYRNFEKLLGFNYDLEYEDTNMNLSQWEVYSETMEMTKNKIANLMKILSQSMMSTNAYGFELLSVYLSQQNKSSLDAKKYKILSHIELAKAVKQGIAKSYEDADLTGIGNREDLTNDYSDFLMQYKIYLEMLYEEEELTDYQAFKAQAYGNIDNFLSCIDLLSSQQDIDFENMSEEDFDALLSAADGIWSLTQDMEEFYNQLMNMMFANIVFNFISPDSIIENSRKIIQDIIIDTYNKITDNENLEDYLEFNY